jgi:hypothetical protein
MTKLEFLKSMYALAKNPNPESLKLSLADTHQKGIFSLVVGGTEFGKLTRVFISETKLKPFDVQFHTHRYPIRLTMIKGNIKHYVAFPTQIKDAHSVELSEFEYKSPLNGGSGLKYLQEGMFVIKDYSLPVGSTIEMTENEYHTMACSKGSIWIVEEQGFKTESSRVLGVPFITDGLYKEPKMFQVNDKCQVLAKELKRIILDYEVVS